MISVTPHTWEVRDHVGILALNDPPGNFLSDPEFIPRDQFYHYLSEQEIKGLIITGTGKHFSGGAGLETLFRQVQAVSGLEASMEKGKLLLDSIDHLEIPVVAAIKGLCFGGGLEIALSCDIRICSANALFAFPESNHNMMPGLSGTYRLPQQVNFAAAIKMILGGDMVNAEEALEMKLVDRVVYDEDPLEQAHKLLKKITEGRSLKVIRYIMRAIRNAKTLSAEDALKEETRMFCELAAEEAVRRMKSE